MQSKLKVVSIVTLMIFVAGGAAWYQWFRPAGNNGFTQKEISIEQAEIPEIQSLTYQDYSGYKFDYPSLLAVKEVEIEEQDVYSSLELINQQEEMMTIRVTDSSLKSLEDWKRQFEQTQIIRKLEPVSLHDLEAWTVYYGAPEKILTIAVFENIAYQVENQSDTGGFWDQTHQEIVESFRFTNLKSGEVAGSTDAAEEDEGIVLIDEQIE